MANKPLVSIAFPDLPDTYTIPQKTSDLNNDSGFVNASGAAAAAPVQSVNGQTGAVTVSGLSQEAKQALMDCFANTAWAVNNGQTYYDALASALGLRVLSSITAVFTQGSAVIYDTDSLDTLKQYLVVTANYSDSTTATVTDYTLSGTLTAGTSTITVSYGSKTTTFDVTNVEHLDYAWDASSGVAPKDKDGNDIPGTFVDGLYKLTLGAGEYAYAENAPIYCIIEFAAITKSNIDLIPMFAFCYKFANGKGNGFKFYNSNTGKIVTSTSGSTVTTTTNFPSGTQIQTLTATASANGCSVDLDGLSYSGAGVVNNAYLLTTSFGVGNNTGIVADIRIKSIKFRYLEA